ncbi:uncharacterized protein B0T15DRAFT_151803 [Chaetomium strumarium]|uniref:Uncharacterized protein n=1 Tax=Chaetomium strumarium TaxID=1170767 RepID=A0AAJ0GVB4_9PEZI|nr:hypothetical protein B0T15DRAFT_151803 [Chaetomium strumarium]
MKMGKHISTHIFVIAIFISNIGSAVISMLGVYLFMRQRHKAQRQWQDHETVANAALDRAIVSYIAKGHPGGPEATADKAPEERERDVITEGDVHRKYMEVDGAINVHTPPPALPTSDVERTPSVRKSGTSVADTASSLPKLMFSRFMDSAEQVYSDILARPLQRASIRTSPSLPEFVPPARKDDVGWPLTKEI